MTQEAGTDTPTDVPVDDRLCLALYAASRAMTAAYRPVLAELELTYPQYLVMAVLWEDGEHAVGSLAARLALDPSTISPLLKRLEATGLVTRRRDPLDERKVIIAPTEQGRELEVDARDVPAQMCRAIGLPLADQDDLVARLKAVTAHLEAALDVTRSA